MISDFQILNHGWPDRGGWTVDGDIIRAGDGGPVPSREEIEAARPAAEAAMAAAAALPPRAAGRAGLREKWEQLPAYIRGPYRDKFDAANRLLDEGDDEGAIALIEYAAPAAGFTPQQAAVFSAVQMEMKAGIEALPQL